jgi:aminoglycoside phosphotransferase (APT) family kinase protein
MKQWKAKTEVRSAWEKLGVDCGSIISVECLKGRPQGSWPSSHRVVCKLRFKGGYSTIAKRCSGKKAWIEKVVYRSLLHGLESELVRTPRYYGASRESRGTQWWIFTEELKGRPFSQDDADHRILAARWLATVHRHAGMKTPPTGFPDGCHVRARSRVAAVLGRLNDIASEPGHSEALWGVLNPLTRECERLEQEWTSIEERCGRFPHMLGHGDFVPKNLRICPGERGDSLGVFDWGSSGWGAPATDLVRVDLKRYGDALSVSASDSGRLEALKNLGLLFRYIAAIYWELAHLKSSSRPAKSLANLASFQEGIQSVLCDFGVP